MTRYTPPRPDDDEPTLTAFARRRQRRLRIVAALVLAGMVLPILASVLGATR